MIRTNYLRTNDANGLICKNNNHYIHKMKAWIFYVKYSLKFVLLYKYVSNHFAENFNETANPILIKLLRM